MYTMKETCEKIGMSYETLKYYCNQNLVPNLRRDENNHRRFDERNIAWLEGIQALRKAGMSVKDMKQYMEYCLAGKETIDERNKMLDITKKKLLERMSEIQKSINYIDTKQKFYQDVLDGKIEYVSNLIDIN